MIFEEIGSLFVNVAALSDWRYWVMWAIGGLLIYLAIAKDMEPTLLLPLGFGTIFGQYSAFRRYRPGGCERAGDRGCFDYTVQCRHCQ